MTRRISNEKLDLQHLFLCFLAVIGILLSGVSPSHAQVGIPWTWGANDSGQLGDGTRTDYRTTPGQVKGLTGVVKAAGYSGQFLALKSDGTVWDWGIGVLGNGNNESNSPVQVSNLKGVVQIAQGRHTLVVRSDGTVWTWGDNEWGQLGDGTTTKRTTPVRVSSLIGAVQASVSDAHSLALKSNGTVWAWGRNNEGQLGDGTDIDRSLPVRVLGLTQVVQVVAGGFCSFALKSDGTVWAWGNNYNGRLGTGEGSRTPIQIPTLSEIVQLSARWAHTLALKSDGTVWAWGSNESGQVGDGTTTDRNLPVQVKGVTGVVQVVAGGFCSLALKADGTVWGWGANYSGQLGNGDTGRELHPVQALGVTDQTYIASANESSLSVQALELSTKLTPSNLILGYGAPVTLSTTLKNALGGVLINQPVTFSLDGTTPVTVNTTASGEATLQVPNPLSLSIGLHTILITFAGDRLYKPTSKKAYLYIMSADTTVTTGTFAGSPGSVKQLTASLQRDTDGAKLVNQALTFKVDGNIIGTANTDGTGKATLSYKFDETYSVGTHPLTVEYAGDNNHNPSNVDGILNVTQAPTKLSVSSVSGSVGTSVSMRAKLMRSTDKALLEGKTVRFQIDGIDVGSAVTSGGVATLKYKIPNTLALGAHSITVLFDGDSLYLSVANNSATLTIK